MCLVTGIQEHFDQTYTDSSRNKGLSHPLQGPASTKESAATSHAIYLSSIEEA